MAKADPALSERQKTVHDLLPAKVNGYIREDVLKRRLAGLTAREIECTLDQLVNKRMAKGFTAGFGPREWRQTTEAERVG